MKPKKRVMCPDCKRPKMLFETEAKALNFIKFNGGEIDAHGGELRAYYCPACCGWHISSKKYNKKYEGRTDRLINAYKRSENILDEQEKSKIKHNRQTQLVNKIYKRYMADNKYDCIAKFMDGVYPSINNPEKSDIVQRIAHRQESDSNAWWQTMTKEDRESLTDKIAIRAVKLNVDEMCVLSKWLKQEYKLVPGGCGSTIRDKCIIIRNEMG